MPKISPLNSFFLEEKRIYLNQFWCLKHVMSFVRKKVIHGQIYYYLVESHWTSNGARQRVVKYLGKAENLKPFMK